MNEVVLLTSKQAAARLSLSRSSFYKLLADETLPPPIKLGANARWRVSDLDAAVDALAAKRYEPTVAKAAPVRAPVPAPRVRVRTRCAA